MRLAVARLLAASIGVTLVATAAAAQGRADLVFTGGRVYTLDGERPWAEAIAVMGERIVAVGAAAEVRRWAGPATRTIDLKGAFACPGFNDAHVHVDATGALLVGVNLLDVHSEEALVEHVRAATERLPKGSWIVRGDWGAYEQWGAGTAGAGTAGAAAGASASGVTAGAGRPAVGAQRTAGPFVPDRRMVDPVTPDHPLLLSRFDRSVFLANSLALKLAGISEATPSPPGGEIVKDASGRLTGVLEGAAADLVQSAIPPIGFEQRLVQVRAVLREAREAGVTTLQDLSSAEQVMAYLELRRRGELSARINLRPQLWRAEDVAALGLSRGFGDDWLRLVGFKAWVDGIMGNSAALPRGQRPPLARDPRAARPPGRLHPLWPTGPRGRGQPLPCGRRHALDGRAHRQRAGERRVRVPQARKRGRPAGLRQRQPRHQRRALPPEPGLRAIRRGHPADARGRTEGGLVPRAAADHRGGDRGLHQGPCLGLVRGGLQGHAGARQAGPCPG